LACKILAIMKIQARTVDASSNKKVNQLPTATQSLVDELPMPFWMA